MCCCTLVYEKKENYNYINILPLLTVSSSDASKGTVFGNGSYLHDSSVSVTATPESGYLFVGWYNGDTLVSSANPYNFVMPSSDYSLTAQFRAPLVGDKLLFGSYPQTKTTDNDLIDFLNFVVGTPLSPESGITWHDYNYYISGAISSYMWFIDVTYNSKSKYRGVYFTSYRPYDPTDTSSDANSKQDEHLYELNATYWFKYEPLSWRVLSADSNNYLLMSDLIIDSQDYYYSASNRTIGTSTISANNYQYSHIRSWLNGYTDVEQVTNSYSFIKYAFSSAEQDKINTTTVDNSAATTNSTTNAYACDDTNDKLFLLSYADTLNNQDYGFNSAAATADAKRQLKTTDYCQSQGGNAVLLGDYQGNSPWWLRSPHYYSQSYAGYASEDGYVNANSSVCKTGYGIVPAMYVTL